MDVMELTEEASSGATDRPTKVLTDSYAKGGGGGEGDDLGGDLSSSRARGLFSLREDLLLLLPATPSLSKL